MQIILSDHNCEGQAQAIFNVLVYQRWLELVPMELRWFRDVDLSIKASDGLLPACTGAVVVGAIVTC